MRILYLSLQENLDADYGSCVAKEIYLKSSLLNSQVSLLTLCVI